MRGTLWLGALPCSVCGAHPTLLRSAKNTMHMWQHDILVVAHYIMGSCARWPFLISYSYPVVYNVAHGSELTWNIYALRLPAAAAAHSLVRTRYCILLCGLFCTGAWHILPAPLGHPAVHNPVRARRCLPVAGQHHASLPCPQQVRVYLDPPSRPANQRAMHTTALSKIDGQTMQAMQQQNAVQSPIAHGFCYPMHLLEPTPASGSLCAPP